MVFPKPALQTSSEKILILQLLQPEHFYLWSDSEHVLRRWHLCPCLSCPDQIDFWDQPMEMTVAVACGRVNTRPCCNTQSLLFNANGLRRILAVFKNEASFCLNGSSSGSKFYSRENEWEFFLWLSRNPDMASHKYTSVTFLSSSSYCSLVLGISLVNSHLTQHIRKVPQWDGNISCGCRIRFNILQSEHHSP